MRISDGNLDIRKGYAHRIIRLEAEVAQLVSADGTIMPPTAEEVEECRAILRDELTLSSAATLRKIWERAEWLANFGSLPTQANAWWVGEIPQY